MRKALFLVTMMLVLLNCFVALAGLKQEDPLDARTREIAVLLRCPVCQNESVFDSGATLAVEMKLIIREQVAEGRSPEEVISFFRKRYGDFVLMEPRHNGVNWLIWLGPFAILIGGGIIIGRRVYRSERFDVSTPSSNSSLSQELLNELEELDP